MSWFSLPLDRTLCEASPSSRLGLAFKNFLKALNFANAVGFLAEKAMHHPDMKLGWGYVEINLQTHDVGGKVTDKDVELATQVEKLFKGLC